MTAPALTVRQLLQVRNATVRAYNKLRRHVGDSAVLRQELYALARDSFADGLRQATNHNPEVPS